MKVMIDTNVFLYLYTSNQEEVGIFDDLKKIESYLIFPEQIIDEFYRNRDSQLSSISGSINGLRFQITASSSLVREFKEFEELKTKCDECEKIKNKIVKNIEEIQNNPDIDLILQKFKELTDNSNISVIKVSDKIIKKANNRYLRGNPPKSNKSDAIADEIIWELLLSNVNEDLIIVTGDQTYKSHITFLKREFLEVTGKELFITNRLSDAIKKIGHVPSKATEDFDDENQKQIELLSQWEQSHYFLDKSTLAKSIAAATAGLSVDQSTLATSIAAATAGLSVDQSTLAASIATATEGLSVDQSTLATSIAAATEGLSVDHSTFARSITAATEGLSVDQSTLAASIAAATAGLSVDQSTLTASIAAAAAGLSVDQSTLTASIAAATEGLSVDQSTLAKSIAAATAGLSVDQSILARRIALTTEGLSQKGSLSKEISTESQKNRCPVCNNIIDPEEKCPNCGHTNNMKNEKDQEQE